MGVLCAKTTEQGGQPNIEIVLMVKLRGFNRFQDYPVLDLNDRQLASACFSGDLGSPQKKSGPLNDLENGR